jgi:NADH-quinone oxidoreductase subunit N
VVGLAYYVRVAAVLFGASSAPRLRVPWAVAGALAVTTVVAVVVGFAPQLVLDAADLVTTR